MKFEAIPFGAMDCLTALVLIVGIIRGRKRGLSEELLDTLQWVVIIVVGGLFYRLVSVQIGQSPIFGRLFYNLSAYVLIALVAKLVFSFLKRHLGEKLVGADLFGGLEYYLGMMAGAVRFACIYLFLLNFLHAPFYTPEMLASDAKSQEKNFGDIRFPTIGTMQQTVFKQSGTGWAAEKYLARVLIEPTSPQPTNLRNDNSIAKRREHAIDDMIGRK